jgi:hypothetical protein
VPRLLVRTGLIAGVVLLLVSCAPPPQIQRALSESTPPLYKRLLTASELPEGWLLAQSSPDHPLAAGTEPTQAPCDRNYAEELDSGRDRTIASRVFVNGGSLFQQSIVSSVDGAQFHNLANAIEACAGIVGATQIQGIPAEILTTPLDFGLPRDVVAVTVLVVTEYEAFLSVWVYARAPGDTLLTISVSHRSMSTPELTAVLERAVRKARGGRE